MQYFSFKYSNCVIILNGDVNLRENFIVFEIKKFSSLSILIFYRVLVRTLVKVIGEVNYSFSYKSLSTAGAYLLQELSGTKEDRIARKHLALVYNIFVSCNMELNPEVPVCVVIVRPHGVRGVYLAFVFATFLI